MKVQLSRVYRACYCLFREETGDVAGDYLEILAPSERDQTRDITRNLAPRQGLRRLQVGVIGTYRTRLSTRHPSVNRQIIVHYGAVVPMGA